MIRYNWQIGWTLRKHLPYGFTKSVKQLTGTRDSDASISRIANGENVLVEDYEKIREAMAWLALENVMEKIFAL